MAKLDKKTQREIALRECREYIDFTWDILREALPEYSQTRDGDKFLKKLRPIWAMGKIHWVNMMKAIWPF